MQRRRGSRKITPGATPPLRPPPSPDRGAAGRHPGGYPGRPECIPRQGAGEGGRGGHAEPPLFPGAREAGAARVGRAPHPLGPRGAADHLVEPFLGRVRSRRGWRLHHRPPPPPPPLLSLPSAPRSPTSPPLSLYFSLSLSLSPPNNPHREPHGEALTLGAPRPRGGQRARGRGAGGALTGRRSAGLPAPSARGPRPLGPPGPPPHRRPPAARPGWASRCHPPPPDRSSDSDVSGVEESRSRGVEESRS